MRSGREFLNRKNMLNSQNHIFGPICRTCMSQGHTLHKLDKCVEENHSIWDLLIATIPLIFSDKKDKEDLLPEGICNCCLEKLKVAYEFQQLCAATNERLHQLLTEASGHNKPRNDVRRIEDVSRNLEPDDQNKEAFSVDSKSNSPDDLSASFNRTPTDCDRPKCPSLEKGLKSIDACSHTTIPERKNPNYGIGEYKCSDCGKDFKRAFELRRHSVVHSKQRPHQCPLCRYRYATKRQLNVHINTHNNATKTSPGAPQSAPLLCLYDPKSANGFPCESCKRAFKSLGTLAQHMSKKHPEVQPHKCHLCEKSFSLHAHLTDHLNRHNGLKQFSCGYCKKTFAYNATLKQHVRTHTGETPYLCSQCGKSFRNASNMRQHLLRHNNEKHYQCSECPSKFSCQADLIKHMSIHREIKPHVCDICGSRFTRSYTLAKHKLIHTGRRPYKCEECHMTFVFMYHMRRHMRTHTGEKPYKCKYCERAYAESGDLTKHLRSHIGENTYMCDKCPQAFKYQVELRNHQSQHYKETQQTLNNSTNKTVGNVLTGNQ